MAKKAKETLGVESLEVVVDRGYCNGEEVKACEQSGMTAYVPKSSSSNLKRGLFTRRILFISLTRTVDDPGIQP
jgi:hypothetical protein